MSSTGYLSIPWNVEIQFPIDFMALIYLAVVGDSPFPEFPGCYMISFANIDYLTFVWVLMAIWDTCECPYAFNLDFLMKGSDVGIHIGTYHSNM